MSSQIVSVTMQAAMFSALSTSLAQGINVWNQQKFSVIDPTAFLGFMLIAILVTPPNYLYQLFLENTFPSKVRKNTETTKEKEDDRPSPASAESDVGRLSISNTAAKLFLDQSIGAAVNTLLFIFLLGMVKGKSLDVISVDIRNEFWPMITAGWRVWPMVTLLNLAVVPFDYRPIVGNTVGVVWGVYMTLKTM